MKIKFVLNPCGPSCNHVEIKDSNDNNLFVTTKDELLAPIYGTEAALIQQIKLDISRLTGEPTWDEIKTSIELMEYQ